MKLYGTHLIQFFLDGTVLQSDLLYEGSVKDTSIHDAQVLLLSDVRHIVPLELLHVLNKERDVT